MPPLKALKRAECHFSPDTRVAACAAFYTVYKDKYGISLHNCGLPSLMRGCKGDGTLRAAYKRFETGYMIGGLVATQGRTCTETAYYNMLTNHFLAYSIAKRCPDKRRKSVIHLTQWEAGVLVRLLTTPHENYGLIIKFGSLKQAAQYDSRIEYLCFKSGVSMPVLLKWLKANYPELQHKPEDRVPQLCPSTLGKRRECADVWRGERTWFQRPPQPQRVAQTRAACAPSAGDGCAPSAGDECAPELVDVKFNPAWARAHTFMLDAITFSDQEGPLHSAARKVFTSKHDVYPPTPVQADKSINKSTHIMVYAVIHPEAGLLVGPDVQFTGTKFPFSKTKKKQQQFEEHQVKTWCVH